MVLLFKKYKAWLRSENLAQSNSIDEKYLIGLKNFKAVKEAKHVDFTISISE